MKKIIIIIFLFVYLILPYKLNALENDSVLSWQIDKKIYAHRIQNNVEKAEIFTMLIVNGKEVYCVQPGTDLPKDKTYHSTTDNILNLDNDLLKYITLIGYYGYKYENHDDIKYYMAAQELIWEALNTTVWWTTDDYSIIIDIESYKNEILKLVNNYEVKPKFNFKDNYVIGNEITVEDENNVLDNYYSLNNNVKIDGNNLTIKIENEKNEFTLKRKTSGDMTIFYYKDGYQTTALFKAGYPFDNNYIINGIYKDIILEKKDFDTKESISVSNDATLKDAIYGLYDKNNNLIKEELTDEKGKLIFHNIPYGKYYIKEIKPSIGYTLDDKVYDVIIDENDLDIIISYEKIIENKINIIKFLKDDDNLSFESNIEFELYDDNNNLYGIYKTDEKGIINITLPYGKYLLKQKTNINNTTMAEDIIIEVIENNKTNNIVLINKKIKLPKTGKKINYFKFFIIKIIMYMVYVYEKKSN